MRPESVDRYMPKMKCDTDCGECCGPVVCSQPEYERVEKYAEENEISPADNGVTCPWYQEGECAVYPARPSTCRLFGHVESMVCPRGHSVNVKLSVERRIVQNIILEMGPIPPRFLHESVYTIEQLVEAVERDLVEDANEEGPEAMKAYHGARALKMTGLGFQHSIMLDPSTGEYT